MRDTFRLITLVSMIGLLMSAFGARAQDVTQQDLVACASRDSAEEQLACYESLIRPAVPAAPVEELPVASVVAPTAEDVENVAMSSSQQEGLLTAEVVVAPVAESEPIPEVPESNAAEKAETIEVSEPEEPAQTIATVREVSEGRYGNLYFHLGNGEVWRQNEARRFRYPKTGQFEVILSKGMMGDYRIRIGEDGPMTRISRVE